MYSKSPLLIFFSAFVIVSGCKDATEYPIEPIISFKSLTSERDAAGYTSRATLVVSFTDGDGDVGLDESYNYPPFDSGFYYDNFFVTCFVQINNVWTADTNLLNGRIKPLTPEGRNKSIRGDISFMIEAFPIQHPNRPMRYEVYLYDRALHRSNTITTGEILLNTY